ncbi:MAG: TlpA disulfide reductase family protein [Sphingomicrobium sp.]
MRTLLRFLSAITLVALAVPAAGKNFKVGQPVPDFELVMLDGARVHPKDLRGQVVVLNFWATWCGPCRTELPFLDNYYRIAQKRGWPLQIYAVATEDSLPLSTLKPLFAAMAIPSARRISGAGLDNYNALPTNYIIDRAGVLRYAASGALDIGDANRILVPLMQEPAPAN